MRAPQRMWPIVLWHLSIVVAIALGPSGVGVLRGQGPVAKEVQLQLIIWSASFLFAALLLASRVVSGRRVTVPLPLGAVALSWAAGGGYLYMAADGTFARKMAIVAAVLSIFAVAAPYFVRRLFTPVAVLSGVAALGLVAIIVRDQRRPPRESIEYAATVQTASYNLALTTVADLRGRIEPRGGGVVALSRGYLVIGGEGKMARLNQLPSDSFAVTMLAARVPMKSAGYDSAARKVKDMEPHFRVTSALLDTMASPAVLYVAHHAWNERDRCQTLRVSKAAFRSDASPRDTLEWTTIFDSRPCMVLTDKMDGNESGGRLAWAPDGGLLLSIGDYGFNGMDIPVFAQDSSVDYGKVMHISRSGTSQVVSIGHRNMQGLLSDDEGKIWSVEHGPQGGDELNQIQKGGNYGWPYQTDGTDYGKRSWPMIERGPVDAQYVPPQLSFVPSIAPSSLIEMKGNHFPRWKGDFLIGTLRLRSLYRVRRRNDRVRYVEPIVIGTRIRDLTEGTDGTLMLWTDTGLLIRVDSTGAK